MQIGPGVDLSMRMAMIETQRVVSTRTLRSAAATHNAKSSPFSGLRTFIGTRLSVIGQRLVDPKCGSLAGDSTAVICA